MTSWILVIWIYTGQAGFPSYFGEFTSKTQCEKVFTAIEVRMPGNGITINNHMCVNKDNPLWIGVVK